MTAQPTVVLDTDDHTETMSCPPSMIPTPTPWDRECMAWHEAGHAVVSLSLPDREPVVRISIEPGDDAFGIMRTAPRPHHNDTRESLLSAMAVALAGPLSERTFLHRVTTSGADDFSMAFSIARDMVRRFGMGRRTRFVCPGNLDINNGLGLFLSENTRLAIDSDVRNLILISKKTALSSLRRNSKHVAILVRALLEHGSLSASDIDLTLRNTPQGLFQSIWKTDR